MKSTFKRARLAVAMFAALGAVAVAPTSQAVNLSDNGLGDVGLVPYYTVRNGFDTFVHVINTSPDYVVAFKIRFREADNSRDARDFNVFLSPNDVWAAVVTMNGDGIPVIQTGDSTCTAPELLSSAATMGGMRGIEFTSADYTGGPEGSPSDDGGLPADGGDTSIERTTEGHFEVIAMGVASPYPDSPYYSALAAKALHGSAPGAAPADCPGLANAYRGEGANDNFQDEFYEPLNVLKVSAYILNVNFGVGMGVPVTTLANFYNPNLVDNPAAPDPLNIMRLPSDEEPNMNDAFPPVADQVVEVQGAVQDSFTRQVDAVSSLLTATAVVNEYAIGGAANALNDWVVTFPTKEFYVDNGLVLNPPVDPFEQMFQPNGSSCVTVGYNYFDREENSPQDPEFCEVFPDDPDCTVPFSPRPPDSEIEITRNSICQEVQTLSFADPSVLGSANNYGVQLADGYTSGWLRLRFLKAEPGADGGTNPIQGAGYTYWGLPTIGFSVKTLENGVANSGGILNYGVVTPHSYAREVDVAIQ